MKYEKSSGKNRVSDETRERVMRVLAYSDFYISRGYIRTKTGIHSYSLEKLLYEWKDIIAVVRTSNGEFYMLKDEYRNFRVRGKDGND